MPPDFKMEHVTQPAGPQTHLASISPTCLRTAFTRVDPKSAKSTRIKASCKTLMKLTPAEPYPTKSKSHEVCLPHLPDEAGAMEVCPVSILLI